GAPFARDWVVRGTPRLDGGALVEHVEVHGGPAFLVVSRGACEPTVLPIHALPGFIERHRTTILRASIPSCAASRADMIVVPAGSFVYGGLGDPPSAYLAKWPALHAERLPDLAAFSIDRTEVTNAAYRVFSSIAFTGIRHPEVPRSRELEHSSEPKKPIMYVSWHEARAFCGFHGKRLPTTEQWVKSLRGGLQLADGTPNPHPRRNFPWGTVVDPQRANVIGGGGPRAVGTTAGDVSPYGIVDLGGNVSEWTATKTNYDGANAIRIMRGGNWDDTSPEALVDYLAIENPRPERDRSFMIGFRCVSE
ncbi:MAG: SUMF1/EgtB/PvdO family nonheme iron enzyme, partial [Deltaproteobacteria bacterium]|nr:SUMF1/EgtB/PvdO family nonheme iron enzyme [Deltaproteobacteria bacterium]